MTDENQRKNCCDEILSQIVAKYPELHTWSSVEDSDDLDDVMNDLFYDLRDMISKNIVLRNEFVKNDWGK